MTSKETARSRSGRRVFTLAWAVGVLGLSVAALSGDALPHWRVAWERSVDAAAPSGLFTKLPFGRAVNRARAQDPGTAVVPLVPNVATDKTGYFSGETVLINGSGFVPGDVLTLRVEHADGTREAAMGHEDLTALVDSGGAFSAEWSIGTHVGKAEFVLKTKANLSGPVADAAFGRIAFIYTDKFDYPAGDTAVISGLGFLPNEEVVVRVEHSNGLNDGQGHEPIPVQADDNGNISLRWFVNPDDSLSAIMRVTAVGQSSQLSATTTFTDPPTTFIDDTGADETSVPRQRDLTQMSVDYAATPGTIGISWNWDNTGFNGGSTSDACALFDSDGDGFANYALCVTIGGTPASMPTGGLRLFSCADAMADRCHNASPVTVFTSSATASVVPNSDPFAGRPTPDCLSMSINPTTLRCGTADTVANLTAQQSDIGGAATKLTNVCAYSSSQPNTEPADCVVAANSGVLTIRKTTLTSQTDTTTFSFTSSKPSLAGVSAFSAAIAGAQTGVTVAGNVSFSPGTVTLTEDVPGGWTLSAASCLVQTATPTPTGTLTGNQMMGVTIQPGVETICTFENSRNNTPPVAKDDSVSRAEDSPATDIDVLANDSDADGESLTVTGVTQPLSGLVSFTAGAVSYTPQPNFNGTDTFTYTISDGHGGTAIATVNVIVDPVNDAPEATDGSDTTAEDAPLAGTVKGTDVDNDALTFAVGTAPAHGTVSLNANGSFTYTPALNYHGPDSFTFTAGDGQLSDTGTFSITVTPVNDAPEANDGTSTTPEDTPLAASVTATDVDSDPLTFTVAVGPSHGTLSLNADGSFSYTPALNYYGPDSFSFTVTDGQLSDTATFSLTVTPVNDAPEAQNDAASTDEDNAVTVSVLTNDSDVDGDALTVASATPGTNGTVAINAAGTVTYTPNLNFFGSDTFTYTVSDSNGATAAATVTVTIAPVNDAPVALDDSAVTAEDTVRVFPQADLKGNDTDVDNSNAQLSVTAVSNPVNGVAVLNGDGTVTFTPALNFHGTAGFDYTVSDGSLTDAGHVTLTVTPVNDAPEAANGSGTTPEDTPLAGSLTGSDVDGDAVTFAAATGPAHGTVAVNANGSFTYTPAADYYGPDSFTFTVTDGTLSDTATFDLTVTPVNDVPSNVRATIAPASINENDEATISGSFSDPDPTDGHTVTVNWGDGSPTTVLNLAAGTLVYSASHLYRDDNPSFSPVDATAVTVTVVDPAATAGTGGTSISVTNLKPAVGAVLGPTSPTPAGGLASVSTTFSDIGTLDTHQCTISWDDGSSSLGQVSSSGGAGTCSGSKVFAAPGVYTVAITVTDDDTGTGTTSEPFLVVVYDPSAGFVTGGGWIDSPAGAYRPAPALVGRGSFGFVSQYKKGATVPTGQTEFHFQAGSLNFHSSAYDWLVVSGCKAQYKGAGWLNGVAGYKFLLTATDGNKCGSPGPDRFRIKITDAAGVVVYDNNLGASDDVDLADPQAISSGSIVIHEQGKK